MYRLLYLPQVDDLQALERRSLQLIARDLILRIRAGQDSGMPLDDHPAIGDRLTVLID